MSDFEYQVHDSRFDDSPPRGEDLLPPVEPPSAGFILQLFVWPALIVLAVVAISFTFSWLVRRTANRPEDLIQGLEEGPRIARWQRASDLANALRNDQFAEFKRNPAAAQHLAEILNREIEASASTSGMDDSDVTLRFFLARALGEFEVQEGLDALVRAAETNRDPGEQIVRRGALEAIAMRAYKLRHLSPPQPLENPEVEAALVRLSADEDPLIRLRAAYALSQLDTPGAIKRLEVMVLDPHRDTRYNAAVALARHGNAEVIETLAEMLDPEELASADEENEEADKEFKRALIVSNALQAVSAVAESNPGADYRPLIEVLERLVAADDAALAKARIPGGVVPEAQRVLDQLLRLQQPREREPVRAAS